MKMVLQKYIADSGYCSRRKAEELIKKKKVKVNSEIASPGKKVIESDEVKIDNKIIKTIKEKIYIILNKPAGYTCTNRKFKDEKNVFDLINIKERLFVVGRLDKNSQGLVLLTNDGEYTNKLTHPKYEHEKEYIVGIRNKESGIRNQEILKKFKRGVDIGNGDGIVKTKETKYLGDNKFKLILTEGKKRQIRRMFEAVSCEVCDLVRTRIGNVKLGELKLGKWKKIQINN